MERDRDRLGGREDRLSELQTITEAVDVVDHDARFAELRAQLRDDVHPMLRHVLQRRAADREGGVQGDHVHGGDVVQLGVCDAAGPQLGGGAGGREAAGDAA